MLLTQQLSSGERYRLVELRSRSFELLLVVDEILGIEQFLVIVCFQ